MAIGTIGYCSILLASEHKELDDYRLHQVQERAIRRQPAGGSGRFKRVRL
jgi:hypothetical protein